MSCTLCSLPLDVLVHPFAGGPGGVLPPTIASIQHELVACQLRSRQRLCALSALLGSGEAVMLCSLGSLRDDCVWICSLPSDNEEASVGQGGPFTASGAGGEARLLGEHKHSCTLIIRKKPLPVGKGIAFVDKM
jgi:hypothetical protein